MSSDLEEEEQVVEPELKKGAKRRKTGPDDAEKTEEYGKGAAAFLNKFNPTSHNLVSIAKLQSMFPSKDSKSTSISDKFPHEDLHALVKSVYTSVPPDVMQPKFDLSIFAYLAENEPNMRLKLGVVNTKSNEQSEIDR